MLDGSRVARRALGLVLVGCFILSCAPAQASLEGAALPLPASTTPSFRLSPSVAPTLLPSPSPPLPGLPRAAPVVWAGGEGSLTAFGPEGWQTFEFSGLVRDIAIDRDGNAILAPGLRICNGRLLRDLLPRAPGGEQDAVAIDPSGRIWVGYYGGIAVLDGAQWSQVPLPGDGSTRAKTVRDLAIDGHGVVWVATAQGLASFDGQGWQQYSERAGPGGSAIVQLSIDRDGNLWVAHDKGLSVLRGKVWQHFPVEAVGLVRQVAAGAGGAIAISSPDRGLLVYNGRQWRPPEGLAPGPTGAAITALAVDGAGRMYAGTGEGLYVADGARWLAYREANSGLADDHVSALAVAPQGAATLPAPGPTRYGNLAGQVTLRRRPVAGARVVLCSNLLLGQSFRDTPCEGASEGRVTRTGVDGRYLFEQVPLGHYAVAAEVEPGRWVTPVRVLSAMHYRVREGQTVVADTIEGGE